MGSEVAAEIISPEARHLLLAPTYERPAVYHKGNLRPAGRPAQLDTRFTSATVALSIGIFDMSRQCFAGTCICVAEYLDQRSLLDGYALQRRLAEQSLCSMSVLPIPTCPYAEGLSGLQLHICLYHHGHGSAAVTLQT